MRLATLALVAVGCSHPAGPAAPAPAAPAQIEPMCAQYLFGALYNATAVTDGATEVAFDRAAADVEAADAAADRHDLASAATHYLACAGRFRAVPPDDRLREPATANATTCYHNAIYAFAMAGQLASIGRPALELAIDADPPLADTLRALVADAPDDCAIAPD